MSNNLLQAYTDYVINVQRMAYDNAVTLAKTTQEFVAEAHKINPYKDVFGVMDTIVDKAAKKSK